MNIYYKFKIGDTIYVMLFLDDMYVIKEVKVKAIKIVIKEEESIIRYDTKALRENTWINGVYENLCFANEFEALAECERRNNNAEK